MGKLADIADVQISLGTLSITERSFNDMLILGSHMLSTNRALVITDSDELLDMGLSATDPLYFAARDAFSQTPHIRQVYVGRRQVDEATLAVTRAAQTWRGEMQPVLSKQPLPHMLASQVIAPLILQQPWRVPLTELQRQ